MWRGDDGCAVRVSVGDGVVALGEENLEHRQDETASGWDHGSDRRPTPRAGPLAAHDVVFVRAPSGVDTGGLSEARRRRPSEDGGLSVIANSKSSKHRRLGAPRPRTR
jgi:hypothetical protein